MLQVFESYEQYKPQGAGVGVMENGQSALEAISPELLAQWVVHNPTSAATLQFCLLYVPMTTCCKAISTIGCDVTLQCHTHTAVAATVREQFPINVIFVTKFHADAMRRHQPPRLRCIICDSQFSSDKPKRSTRQDAEP